MCLKQDQKKKKAENIRPHEKKILNKYHVFKLFIPSQFEGTADWSYLCAQLYAKSTFSNGEKFVVQETGSFDRGDVEDKRGKEHPEQLPHLAGLV